MVLNCYACTPMALHWFSTGTPLVLHWRCTSTTLVLHWYRTDVTLVLGWRCAGNPPVLTPAEYQRNTGTTRVHYGWYQSSTRAIPTQYHYNVNAMPRLIRTEPQRSFRSETSEARAPNFRQPLWGPPIDLKWSPSELTPRRVPTLLAEEGEAAWAEEEGRRPIDEVEADKRRAVIRGVPDHDGRAEAGDHLSLSRMLELLRSRGPVYWGGPDTIMDRAA